MQQTLQNRAGNAPHVQQQTGGGARDMGGKVKEVIAMPLLDGNGYGYGNGTGNGNGKYLCLRDV